MICKIINEYWNVPQINPELQETFQNVKLKKNKNCPRNSGGHRIKKRKEFKTHLETRKGECEPCNTNKASLCCKLVINNSLFPS